MKTSIAHFGKLLVDDVLLTLLFVSKSSEVIEDGDIVTLKDSRFVHSRHLNCSICQKALNAQTYQELQNKLYCMDHRICYSCAELVKDGEPIVKCFEDRIYHQHHFKCNKCDIVLKSKWYAKSGSSFCEPCFLSEHDNNCPTCGHAVENGSDAVFCDDKVYHKDHIVCNGSSTPLAPYKKAWKWEGKLYCNSCNSKFPTAVKQKISRVKITPLSKYEQRYAQALTQWECWRET